MFYVLLDKLLIIHIIIQIISIYKKSALLSQYHDFFQQRQENAWGHLSIYSLMHFMLPTCV